MKKMLAVFNLILALAAVMCMVAYLDYGMRAGQGLVQFFAQFGIALDPTPIFIVLGLIPAFWIFSLIIKTWSAK